MRYLLFTLYAPMGSCGEIAVGGRRMSWARPGRSAILGLAAAAQGIERSDEKAHRDLEEGLYYAVRTDAPGSPFMDYQTAQAPKAKKSQRFATRRQEVECGILNTVLSMREWRSDVCFTIALWPRRAEAVDLAGLAESLRRPHFTLYLGRKSAPLGLPLRPDIIEADTFMDAFKARRLNDIEKDLIFLDADATAQPEYAFDHDAPGAPDSVRIERRRDSIMSRTRWQFSDRSEAVFVPGSPRE